MVSFHVSSQLTRWTWSSVPKWYPVGDNSVETKLKTAVLLLQKMSEWVAVCADEAEEPVEIPTEADGETIPLVCKFNLS